jgi:hypothetical protein
MKVKGDPRGMRSWHLIFGVQRSKKGKLPQIGILMKVGIYPRLWHGEKYLREHVLLQ